MCFLSRSAMQMARRSVAPTERTWHARTARGHGARAATPGWGLPLPFPQIQLRFSIPSLAQPGNQSQWIPRPDQSRPRKQLFTTCFQIHPSIRLSEVGPWGCRCGGKWGRGSAATPASPRRLTTSGCCWAPPGARRARPRATRYGSCLSAAAASVTPATVLYDRFPRHHYRRWRRSRCDWATSSARNPVIIISSYFIAGYKFGRCKQILGCSRMQPARTAP